DLAVTAAGVNKVYDGTTDASVTFGSDKIAADALTFAGTAAFDNKNAGTGKAVAVSGIAVGGADAGNYNLVANTASTTAAITKRDLAVTAAGVNKVYDGTTSASVNYASDKVAGDALTFSGAAAFDTKNVGTGKSVAVSGIAVGGADAGNYNLVAST